VITNGNPQQQKNKIKQINWQGLDSKIRFILANEFIPKPNPGSFKETNIKQTELSQTVYIGDSNTDEEFAANIGIAFIHINLVLHNG
jgi:HAD superfamily hydrolase (TIGR01549 family)